MATDLEFNLDDIVQDINGENVYSNERATTGYLERSKHLLLPDNIGNLTRAYTSTGVDVGEFGKINGVDNYLGDKGRAFARAHPYLVYTDKDQHDLLFTKTAAMNYVAMRDAGLDVKNAYVVAAFRGRWVLLGGYVAMTEDTRGSENYVEVELVKSDNDKYGNIVAATTVKDVIAALGAMAREFVIAHKDADTGAKFVTRHADAFWSCSEYLFRVRGHHFKNSTKEVTSYTDFVQRYLNAAYEGNFSWPDGIEMFNIFHTAIHPFKIKPLVTLTAKLVAHGTIANSSIIRMSGSPVGVAVITTTAAALDTMRAEAWWNAFNAVYGGSITNLIGFARQVNDNKYGFHISAGLYGVSRGVKLTVTTTGEEVTVEEAKSMVSSIAAAAQGMINALAAAREGNLIRSFALSNARALNKAADANPMLSIRINTLVMRALEGVNDAADVNGAIQAALPQLGHGVAEDV